MSCDCNSIINLVSGNEKPDLFIQILDKDTGAVVPLTDPTETGIFRFRQQGATTTLFQATLTKLDSGTFGSFKLVWPASALDVDPGIYEGEVSISYNGDIETIFDIFEFNIRSRFASV